MQIKKQQLEPDMNNRLVQTWERRKTRLYIVTWLLSLYAEYIMWNSRLDESQAGIKIARKKFNNLRYADDTIPIAESEEELNSLLMRVKEETVKAGLKLNIQKTKIMAPGPINSWQLEGEKVEAMTDFIFLGSKIPANGDCSHIIISKRCLLLGRKTMTNLNSILGFPGGSDGKESAFNAKDLGSMPGSGRSLEKEMATHSSILAWRIP